MGKIDCLKLAKEFALKEWNFDIVNPAGEEDGWHYFSCTREGRPKWSSYPCAIRVNESSGVVEEVRAEGRQYVNARACELKRKIKD